MSRWMRSSGDRRKALVIASSQGDSSGSDDNTISASEQEVWTIQKHFDQGGDDIAPSRGMHIAYRTRSRCSVETTIASSQSHAGSSEGSSEFPQTEEGEGLG